MPALALTPTQVLPSTPCHGRRAWHSCSVALFMERGVPEKHWSSCCVNLPVKMILSESRRPGAPRGETGSENVSRVLRVWDGLVLMMYKQYPVRCGYTGCLKRASSDVV
uniref:Uncharacterized protein n=1 Tax=Knipowitschia caucasica TaxID=637954 RepID=A0AAV2K8X2_KNICA